MGGAEGAGAQGGAKGAAEAPRGRSGNNSLLFFSACMLYLMNSNNKLFLC